MKSHLTLIADRKLGHVLTCVQSLGSEKSLKVEQIVPHSGLIVRFDQIGGKERTFSRSDMLELVIPADALSAYEVVVDDPSEHLRAPRSYCVVKGSPEVFGGVSISSMTTTGLTFSTPGAEEKEQEKDARIYCRMSNGSTTQLLDRLVAKLNPTTGKYSIELAEDQTLEPATYALMLLVSGCKAHFQMLKVVTPSVD